MSIPKKIDRETANQLRTVLSRLNVMNRKVIIDLDNETIEIEEKCAIDDILESAGILTPEEARRLEETVREVR